MIGVNKAGTDWARIKLWLEQQIDDLHRQMEANLTVEQYHQLRGAILLCRQLIETVEPPARAELHEDNYDLSEAE